MKMKPQLGTMWKQDDLVVEIVNHRKGWLFSGSRQFPESLESMLKKIENMFWPG
jgi:hypothetical protein